MDAVDKVMADSIHSLFPGEVKAGRIGIALSNIASDIKWVLHVVPSLMTSEREKLQEVREIVLNLKRLEEARHDQDT